jgi:transcriptional regulator with XRE-family HTH domain
MRYSTPSDAPRRHRAGHPHPVDVHVGARVRQRRTVLGMSQKKLGEAIGLTFQQVQKYERGTNRVGASRLYDLSRVLNVPVGFFFEEYARNRGLSEAPASTYEASTIQRDSLELTRIYQRILDPAMRRRFLDLAKAVASAYLAAKDS